MVRNTGPQYLSYPLNPWIFPLNKKTFTCSGITTAIGAIALVTGVLTILSTLNYPIYPFNALSCLTAPGGTIFIGTGLFLAGTSMSWIVSKTYEACKIDDETYGFRPQSEDSTSGSEIEISISQEPFDEEIQDSCVSEEGRDIPLSPNEKQDERERMDATAQLERDEIEDEGLLINEILLKNTSFQAGRLERQAFNEDNERSEAHVLEKEFWRRGQTSLYGALQNDPDQRRMDLPSLSLFSFPEGYEEREFTEDRIELLSDTIIESLESRVVDLEKFQIQIAEHSHSWGALASLQNRKDYMEDTFILSRVEGAAHSMKVAMIIDGHGNESSGKRFASLIRGYFNSKLEEFLSLLIQDIPDDEIEEKFSEKISAVCEGCQDFNLGGQAGASLTCAFMVDGYKTFIFNIGIARTVLIRKDKVIQLTDDAIANEKERFRQANEQKNNQILPNGLIFLEGIGAVPASDCGLPCLPLILDTTFLSGGAEDSIDHAAQTATIGYEEKDYLLLASSGFWEVCSTKEAYALARQMLDEKRELNEIAAVLTYLAFENGGSENISVLLTQI